MFSSASVTFLVVTVILQDFIFVKATEGECPLYTECRPYRKCPALKDKLNGLSKKPYCNFHLRGTYVCCPIPQPPYYTEKDDSRASVRACKSYKPLRQCDKVPLIIGGEKAEAKEFPFMALLMYKTETTIAYYCGGVLISSRYVLTTAHCFVRNPKPNTVRLGELDYNTTQDDAQPIDFKFTYQLHSNYNYSAKLNDVALVKLDGEVQFSDYILPACLPLPNTRDFPQSLAAGWGAVSDSFSVSSSHLLRVKLDGYPSDVCLEKIGTNSLYPLNTTIQLCAGSKDGKRDTCTGDSGGPLFVDHPDDEYRCLHLVLGLTSYSHGGCANKDFPAIYVRLSHYHDWIESIVWG